MRRAFGRSGFTICFAGRVLTEIAHARTALRLRVDEPGHTETWEEMIEDMSIAVGEDLFPFFRQIGTMLSRERLERIQFQGRTLALPVAPLDTGPASNVNLDPIGDYTKPLPRP